MWEMSPARRSVLVIVRLPGAVDEAPEPNVDRAAVGGQVGDGGRGVGAQAVAVNVVGGEASAHVQEELADALAGVPGEGLRRAAQRAPGGRGLHLGCGGAARAATTAAAGGRRAVLVIVRLPGAVDEAPEPNVDRAAVGGQVGDGGRGVGAQAVAVNVVGDRK